MTGGLRINFAQLPLDLESTFRSANGAFALMSNSLPSSCPKAQKAFEGLMPANDARLPEAWLLKTDSAPHWGFQTRT